MCNIILLYTATQHVYETYSSKACEACSYEAAYGSTQEWRQRVYIGYESVQGGNGEDATPAFFNCVPQDIMYP